MSRLTILLASVALIAAGCHRHPFSPDRSAPTVLSTSPANGATGVSRNSSIAATFNEGMAAATLTNGTTFVLKNGATIVPSTVTYAGTTATLTPATTLAPNTVFTATISTAAQDVAGNALAATKTWSFTTAAVSPPTVTSTSPSNGATGVPRNSSVTATFSEAMAPAGLNTTTFVLKNGATVVPGAVTYAGTIATLTPTATLASNTTYTATISAGVQDLEGDALAAPKTWSFTTVATSPTGPGIVNLGTAGTYVILAKSGVSTTGVTSVVGDIGLYPAAASLITGFALTADASNTFSTSSLVNGKVYASNYAVPTPANLNVARGDMETAYTDAAGRTLPDFTELGAGNIQGMTLVPGLYKWGTSVSIPSSVTLTGGVNDVWIFQIGQNLTVGNGAIVTLSGGARAQNVFWQVAGQANLGTTSNFRGIILCQTLISLNTGSVMTGRALAQTAVTLNATAISHP